MVNLSAFLAVVLAIPGPAAADAHPSPSGKHVVTFEQVAHRTFDREEQLRALDNMNHIEYEISFLRHDTSDPILTLTYADVYGFNQPPDPTPIERIHGWFLWSPEEDFVVVPGEGWASAPGTPERSVVALSERWGWSESWIILQNLVWADALVAVGDRHADCNYSVDLFDGRSGEQRPVFGADSPIGHQIASVDGRTVVIRQVLDNCASQEQRSAHTPRCWALDLDTWTRDDARCPGDDERSSAITREQFFIDRATLGEGEVQGLIAAFGEPLEARPEETEAGPGTATVYFFAGVEAYAQGDEVLNIECTNPAYPTPDGARVGDPIERIFEIYGVTEPADAASGPIFGYPLGETDAILMFHVDDRQVTKIELWLNYT